MTRTEQDATTRPGADAIDVDRAAADWAEVIGGSNAAGEQDGTVGSTHPGERLQPAESSPARVDRHGPPPGMTAPPQDRQGHAAPARRRVRWTHALLVSVLAFLLWLLIDAPTLQHNAEVSPVGVRRTVALDLLGPIAAVSRGLQLSHIVSVADGLIGRHGNLPGSGSQVRTLGPRPHQTPPAPRTTAPPKSGTATTTTTAVSALVPTAAAPLRVLIIGDSLGLDLGDALQNSLVNTGVVSATLDGKEATGLTRPDYYNWPAELQADLPKYNPQVVVIMMGANDPQDFPGPPDIPYGSAQWNGTYSQRVQSFMAQATSRGAKLIWVGMPPMANPGLSSEMQNINAIDQAAASKNRNVTFVPSATLIATPQGQYTPYVTVNGQEVNVREPDGTHISPGGGAILSQQVMNLMRSQLHIQLPGH